MMKRILRLGALLGLTLAVGACANYTSRTSPCACDWQPLNTNMEAFV